MRERARPRPAGPRSHYLAEWRKAAGLSQKELAERIGTVSQTISRYESGARMMSMEAQSAIAEALGIRPIDLTRAPTEESLDALVSDLSPEERARVVRMLKAMLEG